MLLQGKTAVVTGSASGVGRATATRFAEEGAAVVCADLDGAGAEETAALIERGGGTAVSVATDVASEEAVAAAVALAVDRFGALDIMHNNVGIPTPGLVLALEDHSFEDFQRLAAVNIGGVFLGCKHAILQFKRQGRGGTILNTGSVGGVVGLGGSVYGATKGAVFQLTRAAAVECAPFDIRVNALCPGAMPDTGFNAAGGIEFPPELQEQVVLASASMHPLGRAVTPMDCAEAALFLCSDLSANITGVVLPIDGGYTAQ